jgi:hypothetical protein
MFFSPLQPPKDDEFIYNTLVALRDLVLRNGRSVVLDCTSPKNSTRDFLLNTRVSGVVSLLVLMIVEKSELEGRNRERRVQGLVEAWDKAWERPSAVMPVMKFRNNSLSEFETSYYILSELLRSKVHPYRRRFLSSLYPRI